MDKNIEVEIRSFISEKQYNDLLKFFKKNAKFVKDDYQETYYLRPELAKGFDADSDLRIQKNNFFSKIWLKSGKIHDEAREEIEIKFGKKDFEKLDKLFSRLNYKTNIRWFRARKQFDWKGIKVCLDFTKGYGYIIELEKLATEKQKDKTAEILKNKLDGLKIKLTPREEFEKKFAYYEKNWRKLTS